MGEILVMEQLLRLATYKGQLEMFYFGGFFFCSLLFGLFFLVFDRPFLEKNTEKERLFSFFLRTIALHAF